MGEGAASARTKFGTSAMKGQNGLLYFLLYRCPAFVAFPVP
jgi:hypothetical protein